MGVLRSETSWYNQMRRAAGQPSIRMPGDFTPEEDAARVNEGTVKFAQSKEAAMVVPCVPPPPKDGGVRGKDTYTSAETLRTRQSFPGGAGGVSSPSFWTSEGPTLSDFQSANPQARVVTVTEDRRMLVKPPAGGALVLTSNQTLTPWFSGTVIVETHVPEKRRWFNFRVALYLPLFKLAYRRNLLTLKL